MENGLIKMRLQPKKKMFKFYKKSQNSFIIKGTRSFNVLLVLKSTHVFRGS